MSPLLLVAIASATASADQKPLWEFGMGIGTIAFEDYRGADTSHVYPVPVPYFVYRGKFLEADRNGVRGKLFNQDRLELNMSVNATTPVRNNSARSGMPDLRPTVEAGPQLNVHLWRSAKERVKFDIRIPARAAVTIEASPRFIGWQLVPYASVDVTGSRTLTGWNLGVLAGPLYANSRYDQYFYSVARQFVTPARPAYEAHGGYAGASLLASVSKRYPSYWVGAYARYDNLTNASFDSSPLVKRNSYWSGGFGIAWMISHSARMVEAED